MARAFPIELIEKLSKDDSLEPIFYKEDKLCFYCAGGKFLTLSKTGCPTRHGYFNYFDTEEQLDAFKNEKDAAKAYDPASCIYRYSKKAMDNRAHDIHPLGETQKANNPLERLYQQKIAFNNRPSNNKSCGVASFSFGISSEYLWGKDEIDLWIAQNKSNQKTEALLEEELEAACVDEPEIDKDALTQAKEGKRPAPTFIDLVWVDEENKKIVFIEYKMKPASLNGKSGVEDHCAKTFLSMDNVEVKKEALMRYYAKKEFHKGNLTCRAQDFKDKSAKDILLCSNTLVQRKLRQLFSAHMQMPFPFSDYELSAERFVTVARFQGFPRGFYDAIPYTVKTGLLDESFEAVSPALRNADNLPALYNGSGLPQMKTLKKVFFTNPGFFFYLPEAASLWNIIQDPNLFRTMLNLPGIYKLFAFLHQFPGTADFFRDYAAVHGAKSMTDLLARFSGSVKQFAIQYFAMNPAARKHETFIFERDHNLPDFTLPLAYSIPVNSSVTKPIPDTKVDGFRFLRLRTTRDYTAAGRALNNCLNSAYPSDTSVICIVKDSEILAAIEIKDGVVLQARTHGNADIDKSPRLYVAFKKWAMHNALRILPEGFDAEPGNELPI